MVKSWGRFWTASGKKIGNLEEYSPLAARCGKRQISCHNKRYIQSHPVPAKFKHVTNIDTCTLLCCDYSTLWEAQHVNMVEIGARFSDENVKILVSYQWQGWIFFKITNFFPWCCSKSSPTLNHCFNTLELKTFPKSPKSAKLFPDDIAAFRKNIYPWSMDRLKKTNKNGRWVVN